MERYLKLMFICIILVFSSTLLYSQESQHPYQNRKYHSLDIINDFDVKRDSMLNNADYIFEGKVLNEKYSIEGYYNKDKSMIYTSVHIQITKILRGSKDLKLGTIVLLRKGGTIVEYRDGETHFLDYKSTTLEKLASLSRHNTQLFICNKSDFPDNPREIQLDNSQRVEFFYDRYGWDLHYDETSDNTFVGLGGMQFNDIKEIYRFLRKYNNIKTREVKNRPALREERRESKARKDSLLIEHNKIKKKQEEWMKFLKDSIIDKRKSSKLKKHSNLQYSFIFLKNTGDTNGDRYFEFDVFATTNI